MTDNKQKIKAESNGGVKTVIAAVTGAVVGAGVVAAGVVAMRNDKNRDKAKEIIDDVKAKASTYMKPALDQIDDSKSKLKETTAVAKESNKEVKKIWQK